MSHCVLSFMSLRMLQPAHSSSLLFGLDVAKSREEGQIVDSFQGSCKDKRGAQRHRLEQGSRQSRGDGLRHRSGSVRYAGGGRALIRVHHRHQIRLPGGNVHLGERKAGEEQVERQAQVRCEGEAASKTLEGRWVKTMVFTSPMRPASRAATRNETDCRMPTPKNTRPSSSGEASKRTRNQ